VAGIPFLPSTARVVVAGKSLVLHRDEEDRWKN